MINLHNLSEKKIITLIQNEVKILKNSKKEEKIYILNDFNKYYDIEFIENAFKKILNRAPDKIEQAHYLNLLRSGNLSKTEIVIALYSTMEAKYYNINILGIKKRIMMAKVFQLPIIGYLFKLIFHLLTLPRLVKRINAFENYFIASQKELMQELQEKIDVIKSENLEKNDVPNSYEICSANYDTKRVNKSDDMYYSLFEKAFYNHDYVIEKQKIYLPYIFNNKSNKYHLDIGCGRGEFLSILKENHIKAKGIDINSVEISTLKNRGYNVELSDALSYLQKTNEKFSSISAFQVIEHLEYDYLKNLVAFAYDALNEDGILILETICPYNPVTINSFYMDETHKKLIPPELISFILQWVGFKDIKILFSSPLPKELRFKNDMLRSYHDYAVIGYKK